MPPLEQPEHSLTKVLAVMANFARARETLMLCVLCVLVRVHGAFPEVKHPSSNKRIDL